ncbi:MAG TPA: hypothetical protein VGB43_00540 [Flavobacterium sp.]|jgi:hypothetical protein
MNVIKVMIAAFSATNIMTAFSYIISHHYGKLFKEPVMLNYIMHGAGLKLHGRLSKFAGWFAHYIIGLAFVFIYELVWVYSTIEFGWVSGLIFGVVSGFVGILGWRLIYLLPDKKPAAPLGEYYLQLFVAHIIFALIVVVAFKIYEYDPLSRL